MAITDHEAILAHSSLAVPGINRLNPEKPAAFYAQVAFPPSASTDLMALAQSVAPGGNLAGLEVGVQLNSQLAKPLPGVPGDWFVVRASTQYAPYVADGAGNQQDQGNPATHATIKTLFYAGKKVRAAISAYAWEHTATKRRGISFNLDGIMASNDGERLAIGQGVTVNAFAQYADPSKAAAVAPAASAAAAGNPFATQAATQTAAVATGNPFAQGTVAATPAGSNPFAQ